MTTQTINIGFKAIAMLIQALHHLASLLLRPLIMRLETAREKKLILDVANPVKAYTDFTGYKEATIESRTIVDSRGRILAQVKLWIYLDTRMCFREATLLNALLRTSVGINRLALKPLPFGKGDSAAALIEVTVRDFEGWMRSRTPGTQFGIEAARVAVAQPVALKVASMPPPVVKPVLTVPGPVSVKLPVRVEAEPANCPAAAKTNMKAKIEEVTKGVLIDFGLQERTIPGRPTFEQYCVDLTLSEGDNRGMPHRLWGADLERVVAEARVRRGQKVEVHYHGSLPTPHQGGGVSHKKSFTMLVLP